VRRTDRAAWLSRVDIAQRAASPGGCTKGWPVPPTGPGPLPPGTAIGGRAWWRIAPMRFWVGGITYLPRRLRGVVAYLYSGGDVLEPQGVAWTWRKRERRQVVLSW